jgi:hypothetical protein
MRKRVKQLPQWRVIRLKKTPAFQYGVVEAPDKESAIKEAIKKYQIEPQHYEKLMAYRVS